MASDRARIYEVMRQFEAGQSLPELAMVLHKSQDFFSQLESDQEEREHQRWLALRESRLVDALIARLSVPHEDLKEHAIFLCAGLDALRSFLLIGYSYLTPKQRQDISLWLPPIYDLALATAMKLEDAPGDDMAMLRKLVQNIIVRLTAEVFFALGYVESLVEAINKEGLIGVVFAALFGRDLPNNHPDRIPQVRACTIILQSTNFKLYALDNCQVSSVEGAITRYGAAKIARECANIWDIKDAHVKVGGIMVIVLLLHRNDAYGDVCQALIQAGVHRSLVQHHWRELSDAKSLDDGSILQKLLDDGSFQHGAGKVWMLAWLLGDVARNTENQADSPLVIAMTELLEQSDFLLLFANSLLTHDMVNPVPIEIGSDETICPAITLIRDFGGWISIACRYKPGLAERHCRPAWTAIMRNILNLEHCQVHRGDIASKLWVRLYKAMGLDERLEVKSAGSMSGCSWIRCPLFLQEDLRSVSAISKCSKCQKAQYCGAVCQQRDWKSGHRKICQSSVRVVKKS